MTIDWWTLGLQAVNVAVLVWLLQRFFWRPVAATIAQRREATRRTMADAAATRDQATAALAEIERTRAGFAKEREAILAAARADAETTRAGLLAEAMKQAATLEAAARAAIEQADKAAAAAWNERSARLGVAIAERLAARLDGAAVRAAFLDWLVREIQALPDTARQAIGASDATLEIVSAAELNPDEQQNARDRIAGTVGDHPVIAFRADPTLIAGLELHGSHVSISNSWRADLRTILASLGEAHEMNDIPVPRAPGLDQPGSLAATSALT